MHLSNIAKFTRGGDLRISTQCPVEAPSLLTLHVPNRGATVSKHTVHVTQHYIMYRLNSTSLVCRIALNNTLSKGCLQFTGQTRTLIFIAYATDLFYNLCVKDTCIKDRVPGHWVSVNKKVLSLLCTVVLYKTRGSKKKREYSLFTAPHATKLFLSNN